MKPAKQKALEAAGWRFGDAADFLGMDDQERQLLDVRVKLAIAIRREREAQHLTQAQLGERLKTSQPRVAKIERAASDVSLDQLVRAFTVVGGKFTIQTEKARSTSKRSPPLNRAAAKRQQGPA
jgi:predicted XRE-type DNA-binding protein